MADEVVITPEDTTHDGCPLLTKTRIVSATKGVCSTVEWEVRNAAGVAMNLGDWLCADSDGDGTVDPSETDPGSVPYPLCGQVVARFADAVCPTLIYQSVGYSPDPVAGIVKFDLPTDMLNLPGIYQMEVGISKQTDTDVYKYMYIDKGILSVERSLFGSTDPQDLIGPPTIKEIRIALRDSVTENNLLDDVEFDDTEIIQALARPIRQWNETPPPIAYFDGRTFPFYENWLKATIGILMKSAAYWYERNRMAATHGGVSVDDRNKMQPYMLMAQELTQGWEKFIQAKKVSINAANAFGFVSSPYTSPYNRNRW